MTQSRRTTIPRSVKDAGAPRAMIVKQTRISEAKGMAGGLEPAPSTVLTLDSSSSPV